MPGGAGAVEPLRDEDLARRASQILCWALALPPDAIRVKAREGWITLTGTVAGASEKNATQAAVAKTPGLLGLINLIEVV